jgi:hypothetical protein
VARARRKTLPFLYLFLTGFWFCVLFPTKTLEKGMLNYVIRPVGADEPPANAGL